VLGYEGRYVGTAEFVRADGNPLAGQAACWCPTPS
jgi:hypothetical protein